jgi:hypothetical protein
VASEAKRDWASPVTPIVCDRYGDDAHLDTTVQALGLVMPNKEFPQLQYLKQVGCFSCPLRPAQSPGP